MSDIRIDRVIIHILDSSVGIPVLSDVEVEHGSDFNDFLRAHIERIAGGDDTKLFHFHEGAEVEAWLSSLADGTADFVEVSRAMAEKLYMIMNGNPAIPPADGVFVLYEQDHEMWLAILKLNYRSGYTHMTQAGEWGNVNDLIPHRTILPGENQKLSEAALIRLSDMEIVLIEKKYEVNGQKENYFSERFLDGGASLSSKAKLAIMEKAVEKVQQDYYGEAELALEAMKAKSILQEELSEKGEIDLPFVADRIFEEAPEMREQFIEKVDKYNLTTEPIAPQSERTMKKFDKQFITTESGIEIRIPMEQYRQPGAVEFITNPDGTITVVLNNVGRLVSN